MHRMVPDPLVFYFGKSLNIFGPLWWERLHPHNVSMTHLYFKASILRSSSSSQSIANPTRREGATDIVIIGRGQRIPGKYLLPPKLPSGRQFIFHSVANYIDICMVLISDGNSEPWVRKMRSYLPHSVGTKASLYVIIIFFVAEPPTEKESGYGKKGIVSFSFRITEFKALVF